MAGYNSVALADGPALLWDLDESSGTAVADLSGNGNTGKRYTNQSVDATGVLMGWAPLVANDAGKSNLFRGNWTDPGPTQDYPGTGIRADSYKPYVPGSKRSFEAVLTKIEHRSFALLKGRAQHLFVVHGTTTLRQIRALYKATRQGVSG